ncbi:beta-glucosidase [Stackebrandtia endophytica]|uniref:Beta-glucosidase n=1 Tax=Stackebrandtia endophytica TaxID=1496996 RepID=A0A543AQB9_9ACTN|nr:glycoside hydrolase family 3 C-terminal domain-containing protein [Stackebrandtia endophytica]TQL74783.1 beta-glucosidase [Stackebrandtia endophytica]
MTAPEAATVESTINHQLAGLSLADKVRILTGSGPWTLHPLPSIKLRPIAMGDGPAGIRGVTDQPTETGASFPSPTALAATWDLNLATRLGGLFAAEARRHNVDVVLAPVVNLQRTPVGGRHFECFSEDPYLTGAVSGALVTAIQATGVAACAKHFIANDSETARTEYVAHIDERALREVYLAPFETLVTECGVWTVMAAYNGLLLGGDDSSATEHHGLLTGLLKEEWGFDGAVISDWTAANTTARTANAGLDVVMPGPGGPWELSLHKAVLQGEVAEEVVDDKVRRILRLAHRVGAVGDPAPVDSVDTRALLRELGARSTVVLKDDRELIPRRAADVKRLALIGPNAVDTFFQGGGSAHVNPDHLVTPHQGLRAALPGDTVITVCRGGYARPHEPDLDPARLVETGAPMLDLLDGSGEVVDSIPIGGGWARGLGADAASARLRARIHLSEPGRHWLGVGTVGTFTVRIDGRTVADGDVPAGHDVVLDSSVNAPPSHGGYVEITEPRDVLLEADLQIIEAWGHGRFARAVMRHREPGADIDQEIAEAVEAAVAADVAVVMVGTNSEIESEGFDRPDLDLPGRQDELIRQVCRANPNTIVVVNAGAPVLLPWLDEVSTVIWTWFPGQECGDALADVLFGRTEPSGRLPWTLPASHQQVPIPNAIPVDGVVDYREGIHIGYRGYLKDDLVPAAPFGHGMGWTRWNYDDIDIHTSDTEVTASVTVSNVGPRHGHETVQAYLEFHGDGPERPARWLAGFAVVDAAPGETTTASIRIPARAFQVWDPDSAGWQTPSGTYVLQVGRSVSDIRFTRDTPHP